MRIKGLLLSVICVALMVICSSCNLNNDKHYEYDRDSVESIQIVKLDNRDGRPQLSDNEYTVLAQIADHEEFFERLNNVEHHEEYIFPPPVIGADDVVIKINFSNGDCDLVSDDVQLCYRSEGNYKQSISFDKDELDQLINDYLEEKE